MKTKRLVDQIIAVYLLVTALLILVNANDVVGWPLIFASHVAVAAIIFCLKYLPTVMAQPWQFFRDWYPVFLIPVFYKEVEFLAHAFGNWHLTEVLPKLEASLFGGLPHVYFSERFAFLPFSEYLHFCYLSYVVLVPVIGGIWYFRGHKPRFWELIVLFTANNLLSFLFFILFPVDSPYYLADPLKEPLSQGYLYRLVHVFSDAGGARGGAFPSAHVSNAMLIWLVVGTHQRKQALVLAPLFLGLMAATVYGRFHYLLDLVAGLILAAAVFMAYRLVKHKL